MFTRRDGAQLSCGRHTQQGRKNGHDGRENAIGHRAQGSDLRAQNEI